MKNKMILFVVLLFTVAVFAAKPSWTTPSKVHVASFAVNKYSHSYYGDDLRNLNHSKEHRDMFVNSLLSRVKAKYPQRDARKTYYYSDSGATKDRYGTSQLYHSEFVFFSGHGNQQKICLYDYPIITYSGCGRDVCPNDSAGKVYGGDTRWVIFDACLVLNVNKDEQLEYPLNAKTVDFAKVDRLRSVFRGVHAILGFYSLSWEDRKSVYDINGYHDYQTAYLYDDFTRFFIEDGETVWDSFCIASAMTVNFFSPFNNNKGLKPAIAFLRGYDKNGNFHDTSTERFEHTYNRPIEIDGTLELFVKYAEYGVPKFYPSPVTIIEN